MSNVHALGWGVLGFALAAGLVIGLAGCGTPGAPQPPSLNLPQPVADLQASRAGDQVSLTWTMPRKNTDKLVLQGAIPVRVCRKVGAGACEAAGTPLGFAPGAEGAFTETLPASLTTGSARRLSYFVELENRAERSAGASNAAVVLAGATPGAVDHLTAVVRKNGVVLGWSAESTDFEPSKEEVVRLHRKLLTPPPAAKVKPGLLTPPPEPREETLLVHPSETGNAGGGALDAEIRLGESYEYQAQRVLRLLVEGKPLELPGALSSPVRVDAIDNFPPAVPAELSAVATPAGATDDQPSMDLSWQPVTDSSLAGYKVYRREGTGSWEVVSPTQLEVSPAFHDAHVQAGHSYRYQVSAVGRNGRESAPSAETEESVPTP